MAFCACLLALSAPADAHHQRKNQNNSGLSIPNLTHGQLRVMAEYRSAILQLGSRQISPDLETRTLQNFVNLQFTYCLWGLVPGSLTNENNPFNDCSHAYLAATKALLDRLQRKSDNPAAARELAMRIDTDMLRAQSALEICIHSVEPFNTAEIIMPEWAGVVFNPFVLLVYAISLVAVAALFAVEFWPRKPKKAV